MKADAHLYDTSDYLKDHPLYSVVNKKVVGKFKDECNGQAISEFVGLRPKMYSILKADETEIKKAKGISKLVVKKMKHDLYKQVLNLRQEMRHSMMAIRSDHHKMGLYKINKISLSPLDTKKWIELDGIMYASIWAL